MLRTLSTFCCVALLLSVSAAQARDAANPSPARGASPERSSALNGSARAEALVQQARALLDGGRVDEACAKFEASEAVANDLGTLLELGECYERSGRTASAWHTFLEAQAVAQREKDVDRERAAAFRVAGVEPKLTRVVFVVPMTSRVPGLTVRLGTNTISPAAWGTPIAVDPGNERVSAAAKGYATWSLDLNSAQAQGQNLRVNVPTLNPLAVTNNDRQNAYRTAGVVTGSVGLAGLGAGAVFNALSSRADDGKACAQGAVQCTPGRSPDSNKYANAAAVSYALGGALLATGVTLFVLAPAPDKQEKHALRIAARVSGTTGGRLQLEGAW